MAYTEKKIIELKVKIVEEIAINMLSLRKVCALDKMPSMYTVLEWLKEDKEFSLQYARACEIRAEGLADEILDIADDSSKDTKTMKGKDGSEYEVEDTEWVNRSKLRVESRKWTLSKLFPKKYGDKLDITSDNEKLDNSRTIIVNRGENIKN